MACSRFATGCALSGALVVMVALGSCSSSKGHASSNIGSSPDSPATIASDPTTVAPIVTDAAVVVTTTTIESQVPTIDGMPPVIDATNLYSEAGPGKISPAIAGAKQYVYVPSTKTGTVTVIDQATMKVVDEFDAGVLIQHIVPSHDLLTLYANASGSSMLVPIDPMTGKPGTPIPVEAPYNLYFTPDGRWAVVMAERRNRLDYYDPITWKLQKSVEVPCDGPNHADWSIDGKYFVVSCEFSGEMLKVDTLTGEVVGKATLEKDSMPQDVRIVPDGSRFIVADMVHDGIWVLDATTLTVGPLVHTGVGAHGIYPSRDGSKFYVTNRGEGSVSVLDASSLAEVTKWVLPGGGSPDMGGLNADGTVLWLSGRYSNVVYAIDTATGALKATIKVPAGPHGLCVYPQPGRYSLGHTGNFR